MNRTEKTTMTESLAAAFAANPNVILTDFRGLTANQSSELRRRIRAAGGRYRVLKNRMAKRASEGTAVDAIRGKLVGTCGIALHESDPVGLAKVLADFVKENPQLRLVAAVVAGKDVVEGEGIKALAALPGKQELRAQLLALINTPATTLVRLLNTPAGQVARAIDARRGKLDEGGS